MKKIKLEVVQMVKTEFQLAENGTLYWIYGPNGTFFRYLKKSFQKPYISFSVTSSNSALLFGKSKLESNAVLYSTLKKFAKSTTKIFEGLLKSQLQTSVWSSTAGFKKTIIVRGVGFKLKKKRRYLSLQIGYSHEINFIISSLFYFKLNRKNTAILFKANLPTNLHGLLAKIKRSKKPDIYKGKGVRYKKELIFRKEGKKKKKTV